jgi:L-lactate dehydrogenase complex protein LldG
MAVTSARDQILARLREGRRETRPAPAPYVAPPAADPVAQFTAGLEKVLATFETVGTAEQTTHAVESYLEQHNAGRQLVVTGAVRESGLLIEDRFETVSAPTRGNELNAIVLAYAGIAETGSLVMLSEAGSPVTTSFLPDNFICLLRKKDILNDMESLWRRMADEGRKMPRAVNLITGASRTADVEQIIQMGAHGPRRVHVILVD